MISKDKNDGSTEVKPRIKINKFAENIHECIHERVEKLKKDTSIHDK